MKHRCSSRALFTWSIIILYIIHWKYYLYKHCSLKILKLFVIFIVVSCHKLIIETWLNHRDRQCYEIGDNAIHPTHCRSCKFPPVWVGPKVDEANLDTSSSVKLSWIQALEAWAISNCESRPNKLISLKIEFELRKGLSLVPYSKIIFFPMWCYGGNSFIVQCCVGRTHH